MIIYLSVINDLVSDQRMHKVCTSLYKAGHDVTLVGRRLKHSLPLEQRPYKTKRLELFFTKGPLFYIFYNIRLFVFLLFKKCDVLVANDLDVLLANYLISRFRKKHLVYDSHEYFTEVPELIGRSFARNAWLAVERWILPKLKNTITVCESIAEEYKRLYSIDMEIVRNVPLRINKKTVSPKAPTLRKSSEEKILLYQGAVNVGRGIEHVIKAMVHLDQTRLVIVGEGDVKQEMQKLSNELKLNDKVTFLPKIPFQELYGFTIQADIGISLQEDWGMSYKYVLPNRLFDYIQAGIPVLGSPLPEMKTIIERYDIGEMTDNYTPMNLAQTIKSMLSDREKIKYWQTNLKAAAKELCWEKEEQKLLKVYQFH